MRAYDALAGKMFNLRAAVLWCIHDYPALSTLSGCTTKGYFACTHCDNDPPFLSPKEQNWVFWTLSFPSQGASFVKKQ